jgi:hypothetical protein
MRHLLTILGVIVLALAVLVPIASADPSSNPTTPIQSCFGIVAGQLASSEPQVLGEHVSSQSEPRTGLGNLILHVLDFPSVGAGGSFLATIDGNPATNCG